jgi:GMP synthase (glutamine-hydrolysing)
MKTATAIRHVQFEDLGAFAQALKEDGYAIRYYDAGIADFANG